MKHNLRLRASLPSNRASIGYLSLWLGFLIAQSPPIAAQAAITTVGSVEPAYPGGNPDPWNVGAELQVGTLANGAVTIASGSSVTSTGGTIGSAASVEGKVSIAGPDSSWTSGGDLLLGIFGSGRLEIVDGASMRDANASLGHLDGTAEVVVDGSGAQWTTTENLVIANGGNATVTIADHGLVQSGAAWIGLNEGAVGSVFVDGMGATWEIAEHLILGDVEEGGGATVVLSGEGSRVYLGDAAITAGNSLPASETAIIVAGSDESVELAIYNGNRVENAGNAYVANGIGEFGSVVVSGFESTWHNEGAVEIGTAGIGTVVLAQNGTVTTGEMLTNGPLGTVRGNGSIVGAIVNHGAIAPGASIGGLSVTGDFTQSVTGTLEIELSGTLVGEFDTLSVSGQVALGGLLEVTFSDPGSFTPALGDSFEFLTALNIAGQFQTLLLPSLGEGLAWTVETGPTSMSLLVIASGVPGDYNDDGIVDAADYTVWRDTLGSTTDLRADGDNSGSITELDYEIWKSNYGFAIREITIASGGRTVPEPTSAQAAGIVLLLLALWSSAQRAVCHRHLSQRR